MKKYSFLLPLFLLFLMMANATLFAQNGNPKFAPEGGIMIHFDSGKSALDAAAKKAVDAVLSQTKEGDKLSVKVYGHTDAYGADEPNIVLSRKRCYAVWDYVMSKRMYDVKSGDVSMSGEFIPKTTNDNEQQRAENRRVYVVITKL